MSILLLQSGSMITGERLINCIVEGTLIAVFISLLFRLKIFRDSATRFAIWLVTLLAILVLPFIGASASSQLTSAASALRIDVPADLLGYGLAAWALISLFGIIRISVGLLRLRGLRRRACELKPAELPLEAKSILQESTSRRDVRVCVSNEISAPTAIGFIRPAVLMPEWVLSELSGEKLRSVLLHEIGHLRRWDDWTNLLQKVLRAIFFFHPAIWWIDSRLCLEREMACDDMVLAATNDAHAYAECLVSLAERSMLRRGVALAVAAVGRVRQMTLRLGRILDQNSRGRVPGVAMASLSIFGVLAIAASAHLPMLVVLQEGLPSTSVVANDIDRVAPAAAKMQLTSASDTGLHANVVPAMMKIRSRAQQSDFKVTKAKAVSSTQHAAVAAKPKVFRTSFKTLNKQTHSQTAWLQIVHMVQPDPSQIPEIELSQPFSTTIVCGADSGTCAIASSGVVQFTIYRWSGAIRSEFVANVI